MTRHVMRLNNSTQIMCSQIERALGRCGGWSPAMPCHFYHPIKQEESVKALAFMLGVIAGGVGGFLYIKTRKGDKTCIPLSLSWTQANGHRSLSDGKTWLRYTSSIRST